MVELLIGESQKRFDKFVIDDSVNNFDMLIQDLDFIFNSTKLFSFKKNKNKNTVQLILDTDENIDDGDEIFVYSNPIILSIQQYSIKDKEKAMEKLELFIGVKNNDGLKYTIYNPNKESLVKNGLKEVLNNINNSTYPMNVFNKLYIWLSEPLRVFKIKNTNLLNNEIAQIGI